MLHALSCLRGRRALALALARRVAAVSGFVGVFAGVFVGVGAVLGLAACKKEEPAASSRGEPPPPEVLTKTGDGAASPKPCEGGGGTVGDAVSAPFFPKVAGDYCVDPHGETRTYGEKGKLSMDEVCTTAFDGECEVYKRFGLIRTVALRYVDGTGGDGSVEIYLSQFKADDGAYGMYTKRVVADADPAEPSAPRALAAGGSGALGTGRAYVWKGPYLLELQYNNEQESPEKLAQSSEKILSNLGKEIGRRLAGTADLPKAAAALRGDHRLPNGISFVLAEPLGVAKLGPAALGFYKDGEKRYRGLSLVRDDIAVAKGQFQVLRSRPGALPVAGVGEEAVHVILQESPDRPKAEYVVARQGTQLLGVGDEDFATSGQGLDAGARLSKDEKIAKLNEWLASSKGTAPAATPSATAAPSTKAKKP